MFRSSVATSLPAAIAFAVVASGCVGRVAPDDSSGSGGHTGGGGDGTSTPGTGGAWTGGTTGSGGAGAGTPGSGGRGTGSGGAGGGVAIMPPPSALPAPDRCTSNAPGPRRLRRLTAAEFSASIRSIFNDNGAAAPLVTVFSDPEVLGFSVDASSLLVQGLNASQLMDNAEAVAAWAVANNKLAQFGNCSTVDAACAQKFVKAFGRRAFRTTLADSDPRIAPYQTLFMAETTFAAAAQTVVAAMLQSPHFLYRPEIGVQKGAEFELAPAEVANALSYLLTGNMPDDTLLAAADSAAAGSMTMTAMVDQQAQRLIGSSGGNAATGFMTGWLGLNRVFTSAKDDSIFMLTRAMRDNMATETRNLVSEVFNSNGNLAALLTADHSYLNKDLAAFYGINAPGLGTSFTRVAYTPSTPRDVGLLAHGTMLVGYARPEMSSPTQRGHFIRTRLLCQQVPPPPPNVDTMLKPAPMTKTTRQHFHDAHSVGGCYSCHRLMDEIGFGFERYDGFGRRRDMENGVAVDASGTIFGANTKDGNVAFNGLGGTSSLSTYLAQSDDVRRCMIRHWAYYAYGAVSWSQDACTYDAVYQEASKNAFALRTVLLALVHAPTFTRRVQDK